MTVSKTSGYNYCATMRNVDVAGRQVEPDYLDIRPRLVNTSHADNRTYVPQEDDNWSRVAWRFLGDGRYYWIIADYSQVNDLFLELGPRVIERIRTQLHTALTSSQLITSIDVKRGREFQRGTTIRVRKAASATFVDAQVSAVDALTTQGLVGPSKVSFSTAITVPFGGIATLGSTVAVVTRDERPLTIPSLERALFEALDFGNPMNTLIE